MTNPRLLAYRDRLLALEDSAALSDLTPEEPMRLDATRLHFKEDPRWQKLYAQIKAELAVRENVDRQS